MTQDAPRARRAGTKAADFAALTRRHMFLGAAITAGAVASLFASTRQAAAKMTQKAALYQPKPKGGEQCSTCTHFQPPSSCQVVDGAISPNGWCQMYIRKAA